MISISSICRGLRQQFVSKHTEMTLKLKDVGWTHIQFPIQNQIDSIKIKPFYKHVYSSKNTSTTFLGSYINKIGVVINLVLQPVAPCGNFSM